MIRNLLLTAGLIFVFGTTVTQAGHPWGHHQIYSYHSYRPLATYSSVRTVAYRPVFAAPTTVVVQRPVYVAYPVTVPQPVFVETPVLQSHVVQTPQVIPVPQPSPHRVTKVRYRATLWPLGHRDKLRYRIDTPYGTHKYTYRTSWWNGTTKFEYDFDD
ncbi:MAG: hypothetical protein HUJ26_23195 [Planctomycetaceae bacterium]|nr:hypothetical protein [Planctomycetaceae bacterium]